MLRVELRRFLPAYLGLFFISIFIGVLMLVPPLYMIQLSSRVLVSRNLTTLFFLTLIAGILIGVMALLEYLRSKTLRRLGVALDRSVGERLFERLHHMRAWPRGQSSANSLADFNTVRDVLSGPMVATIFDAIISPLFLLVLFLLHPLFGLLALAIVLVVGGLSVLNQLLVAKGTRRTQEASVKELEFAAAVGRGAEAARVMGMVPGLTRRWHQIHLTMLAWQGESFSRAGFVSMIISFLRSGQMIMMLALGALLYIEREIGGGTIFAAMLLSRRTIGPLEGIFGGWRSLSNGWNAYRRLNTLLSSEKEGERLVLPRPAGNLVVSNVYAAPPGVERTVINGISFSLPSGRVLGVVGPSGAGKSCLARLLVGAWEPLRGSVLLDGHDIGHWHPDDLGPYIGFMPQDTELLPGSVAENIARFPREADAGVAQGVMEAVRISGIEDLVQSLPEGFNTRVGPGGHILSGGQRQRVALARAVYGNPSVVVLDEPNSNLDASGEEALGRSIQALRENGTTVVVITHKLNMLVYCDDVLVLHAGAVHVIGSREEIMRRLPPQRLTALRAVAVNE